MFSLNSSLLDISQSLGELLQPAIQTAIFINRLQSDQTFKSVGRAPLEFIFNFSTSDIHIVIQTISRAQTHILMLESETIARALYLWPAGRHLK
jgi:hypothetical protein